MAVRSITERLENGPSITIAETSGDLPPAPFDGLRLGDLARVLTPPTAYQLRPASNSSTIAQVVADGPATWAWTEIDALGPIGSSTTVTDYRGGQRVQRRATATDLICDSGGLVDYLVGVTDTSAPRTITLPIATNGRVIVVKDESGAATVNAITVVGHIGTTIDNNGTYLLNANFKSATFYSDGNNWFVMSSFP